MKHTIFGLSQKKLIEYGLDVSDALIIRWFVDFYSTEKMMKLTFEGKEYCWVSYKYLLECVPILNIKKQALHDRLKKIVICGVFENVCIKNHAGTFSGYRLSNKYENLISDCSELQTGVSSELQTGVSSELQTKDSSIINNSSIKDINNNYSASLESDKIQIEDSGTCFVSSTTPTKYVSFSKNFSIGQTEEINMQIVDFNESQIEAYGKNNPIPKFKVDIPKDEIGKAYKDIEKMKRFQIPTVEEIKAYCLERQNGINPEAFSDYYTAKGWMIGKNKMKDWKAAVRTWENNSTNTVNGKPNDKLQKQIDAKKAREIPETEVWGNNFDPELTAYLEEAKRKMRERDAAAIK